MVQPLGYNDAILLFSLGYSCIDLLFEWELFSTCCRPIHQWLLVSYACVIGFRLMHLAGTRMAGFAAAAAVGAGSAAPAGDFLLDLRQKGAMPRVLASFTWLVALPFFVMWTFLGTSWLWRVAKETPECVPSSTHLWFSGFWLALCYIWIVIHMALGAVAWTLERRVRRAEGNLRQLEDAETISRWGQVSQLGGYRELSGSGAGMTPDEIRALLSETTLAAADGDCGAADDERECPICVDMLKPGDAVRKLPSCSHTFHRACIDLWLLRRADCPLCKRSVRGESPS